MSEHVALGSFEFDCGQSIPELELTYETYGERASDDSNVVLVCHALTGSHNVARTPGTAATDAETSDDTSAADQATAWWHDVVGPGKTIDTREWFVVCATVPGSCYGSSGPNSTNPETGDPYGTDFPPVTVADWTRAQARLLDHLGIDTLAAVVGGSVGGMNVLDWARRYPDRVERVVAIATGARLDAQLLALDGIARRAITTDDDWQEGDYYGTGREPTEGLALARQLAHVTYLSKDSMDDRFGRRSATRDTGQGADFSSDPGAAFFPYRDVESYLDYNADRFTERFDANAYLYLTRAMDEFDLAAGYRDEADALAAFDGEALCLSYTGDWHFTVGQGERLAEAFRANGTDVAHHVVDSEYGHDAFLAHPETLDAPLRDFLSDGVKGGSVRDDGAEHATDERPRFAPVHASLFGQG
ncbi:homoserine O-acetyltransferase MetX [Halomarina oriensis]|uniref:Homoserine O-acetyltransferase n=1 Tax=Halomarina oriensis TaxID=671145 RepID=A0A6B0GI73_9EURY|nr:homoserine O-acetyltransferase [Halomarina oriensis]